MKLEGATELGEIYDTHADGIWRLLRRLGVDDSVVDDAVQDVFIVAHRQLPEFRGESSLRTWLSAIALRVAKDHRRALSRRGGPSASLDEASDVAAGPGPDERAMAQQALARVLEFTAGLDEPQREVFVLVELERLTVAEVARMTGINPNTLSTRLRAARERFNEYVALQGDLR